MTQAWKKGVALFIAAVLSLGMLGAIPGTAPEAHAATKPHMKSLGLKWDLKKNKTRNLKIKFAHIGNKTMTVTMKNYKATKAKKKGYKKVSFTLVYKCDPKPTKTQVYKLGNDYNTGGVLTGYRGEHYYAIVDYDTGLSLDGDNDFGVTVKRGDWKYSNYKTYKGSHGTSWRVARTSSVKITITYPENYKGLCVGAGGETFLYDNVPEKYFWADQDFWEGYESFGQTSYYKKGKTNSHWMRIK